MSKDERGRFQLVMSFVDRALDLPEAERDAVLAECPDDIRRDVRRILAADASTGLSEPAGVRALSALRALDEGESESAGRIIGSFRLIAPLGKGGMGEVWTAERVDADFEQKVAVKLLRGAHDDAGAARFRRERQILAKLEHPHIARLLDGGVTDGRPWLALEMVVGLPLVEQCERKGLDVPARLRLFAEVCDAVQFAHRNLVVHRDLKPSNILVDANGAPKLLDFGIAKLLGDEENVTLTVVDERPMTPEYASPEQIRGEVVTTASDIWTLGAILYELLTGARVDRSVLDTAKARPSARVNDPGKKRRLAGDLDAVVLKAMRPDPVDRYGSVDALAADVRRHLDGSPVVARGETAGYLYLVRTLVRRYRVAVAVSLAVVVALGAGLAITLRQVRRAEAEARRAERSEAFLIDMLRAFDPEKGDGRPVSQRDILERGKARLDTLADEPVEQARLRRVFAETWLDLADADRARRPIERALAIQRRELGLQDLEVAKSLFVLANVQWRRTELDLAERASSEALTIATAREGASGSTAAAAMSQLGAIKCRRSDFGEATRLLQNTVDNARAAHGEDSPETLDCWSELAVCLGDEGRYDESATINRRISETSARVRGATAPGTLLYRHNLASNLLNSGACPEAEAILRDVLAKQREAFGPDYPHGGTTRMLGSAIDCQGRAAEALPLFDDAVKVYSKAEGPESFMVGLSLMSRGQAERHLGRLTESEATLREALRIQILHRGKNRFTARMHAALGATLADLGRFVEARAELGVAVAYLQPRLPDAAYTKEARDDLARTDAVLTKSH